jgi:hypothetical protein
MEETALWNPERVRMVGSIMSRYAQYLSPDDRVTLHIEGDTFSQPFRGEGGSGTVTSVSRDADGTVSFDVKLDGSGETVRRDNVSIRDVWEIEPTYVDTFIERYKGTMDEEEEGDDALPFRSATDDLVSRVTQLEESNQTLRGSLAAVEEHNQELKDTVASVVREISGDMMRIFRGEKAQFVERYVDRYDQALTERPFRSSVSPIFNGVADSVSDGSGAGVQ